MSDELSECGAAWGRVRDRLRAEIGDAEFKSWLSPLNLCAVDGGKAVIGVPTRFMGDWVRRHYLDRITALLGQEFKDLCDVEIMVKRRR